MVDISEPDLPVYWALPKGTIYIIRGLPGSGKNTLGERLTPGFVYSADDYFTDTDGTYFFDRTHLNKAHADCAKRVEEQMTLLTSGMNDLSVANTFTQAWEVVPYLDLATKYQYSIFVIVCTNKFYNTHEVPEEAIQRMRDRWEPVVPVCSVKEKVFGEGVEDRELDIKKFVDNITRMDRNRKKGFGDYPEEESPSEEHIRQQEWRDKHQEKWMDDNPGEEE